MQLVLALDDRPRMLTEIHRRLRYRFGRPGPFLQFDPLSQLVIGILGGKTLGAASMAAFEALLARFGRWEAVRDASVDKIYATISGVTFAEDKAARLKATLMAITARRGRLSIDLLDGMTVDQAIVWLERLPGVGRKAAAATLNFSTLRKASLVIDTHHLRVLQRLQLVGWRSDAEHAYDRLMPVLPDAWTAADFDDHHQLMKRLGQTVCRCDDPRCARCPLRDLCPAATGPRAVGTSRRSGRRL